MRPARLIVPLAAAAALAVSGCGGGSSSGSALDDALGFLPEDAPFVVTIDTDAEGDQIEAATELVDDLPFGNRIENEIEDAFEDGDVDYEKDVKPLLGNEFVVGATDASALANSGGGDNEEFVGAIRVKDSGKLKDLLEREGNKDGEIDGATVYENDGDDDLAAVKDDILVVASTRGDLEDALRQRGEDDRMTEERFEKSTKGLPKDALVKVGGDMQALLRAGGDSAEARQVKWVDALRTFGAALSVRDGRADLDFRLATAARELTDEDLPFAPGDESPDALKVPGEIGIGIRDPRQLVRFFESAAEDTNSSSQIQAARRSLEQRLDIDIEDDLVDQLEDDVALSVSPSGSVSARVRLADESAFRRTLAKIEKEVPRSASSTSNCRRVRIPGTRQTRFTCAPRIRCRRVRVPGSTRTRVSCLPSYSAVRYPSRSTIGDTTVIRFSPTDSVAYQVEDGELLVSNQSYRVSSLERAETESVPGAKGSVSFTADGGPLALALLRRSGLYYRLGLSSTLGSSSFGSSSLTGAFGDVTGSMRTTKSGLSGHLELEVD